MMQRYVATLHAGLHIQEELWYFQEKMIPEVKICRPHGSAVCLLSVPPSGFDRLSPAGREKEHYSRLVSPEYLRFIRRIIGISFFISGIKEVHFQVGG